MQKYLLTTINLWKLLKPFHKDFYIQLFSTVVQQGINVFTIYIIAKSLDSIINKDFYFAFQLTILNLVVLLIRAAISYFSEVHLRKRISLAIQQHLEEYSFKKIFNLNIFQYVEDHSAVKEQVINRGEKAAESIISTFTLDLLPTIIQIAFSLVAISFYSKTIAIWALFSLLIVLFWSNHFAKFHRPFIKNDIDNWDKQKRIRTESFQHLSLIRTMGSENYYLEKYLRGRQKFLDYSNFTWDMATLHGHKRWAFINISRSTSTLIIIYLAYLGSITVGSIYAIWSYLSEANNRIFTIIQAIRQIPIRFTELDKYLEIIDKGALFDESGKKAEIRGDITFDKVSFKYPHGNTDLFNDFSLVIPSGKRVAIVGSSGSGKSTIIKLLLRVYDYQQGSIKIGGVELDTIDATHLRENIGYVEQHVDLFDESIKENMLVGVRSKERKKAEKKLEEVAEQARITEFYHRLGETKFDTYIGERGIKLSGGERQRIGIARAIIRNPEVLIFDEATASLDSENEKYVMEAINDVSAGKTTIIIAHRLSTVRNADKIIVMDKGNIVSEGTHNELMQSSLSYQNLVAHQLS